MIPKPRVFIGSANEDLKVAEAIRVKLQSSNEVDVSIWKDISVFKLSGITLTSLFEALENYDFAILVATPDSRIQLAPGELPIPRDNVIYEMGLFAGRLGYERVFIVIPDNVKLHLATDLDGLTTGLYDPIKFSSNPDAAISNVCQKILFRISELGMDRFMAYHGINSRKYEGVNKSYLVQPSLSSIMGRSPFQFTNITDEDFICSARREVFLAAQNHYSIICGNLRKKAKDLIFKFLRKDPDNRLIRLLFCSPDYEEGIKTWNWVNSEDNNWKTGRDHLIEATEEMRLWTREAKKEIPPLNLEARKANFVPLSMTFIDPEDDDASMVVMPHAFEKVSPKRPCHYLTRMDNPEVYSIYYDNYNRIYYSTTASEDL